MFHFPRSTRVTRPPHIFMHPWTLEEVAVNPLLADRWASAVGDDGVSYQAVVQLPDEDLRDLFQQCVGLESCLPKALNMMIVRECADTKHCLLGTYAK
ncbi:uncharacterized protein FIBRA_09100 [Fibroporia radiculosa]|uniref:Uncharacterized protein n=1 Tax=Fibroporia radiculosa TaxID=599839 RepID=J4GXX8_9APHY|nr:uncharacterized protein FIBRA_09100 [Fibroporia radiculosa]CCM06800.1 predicted protein [Fibroporia radiculosa]